MRKGSLIAAAAVGLALVAWGMLSLSQRPPAEPPVAAAPAPPPAPPPAPEPEPAPAPPPAPEPPPPPAVVPAAAPALPELVAGPARVGQAAILHVESIRLHLDGLRPPREDADCRRAAVIYQCTLVSRGELVRITAGKTVECELARYGEDDRVWGSCWILASDGSRAAAPSVNEQLVRSGWAFADVAHTDALVAAANAAEADSLGLWSTFMRYPPPGTDAFGGRAEVRDGGGVEVREIDIRLLGIDAPDVDQTCRNNGIETPCGVLARGHAIGITAGKEVFCQLRVIPEDDRRWGVCTEAVQRGQAALIGATSINELMVRAGWALAKPGYGVDYSEAEAAARADGIGLWSGEFVPPAAWRLGERLP